MYYAAGMIQFFSQLHREIEGKSIMSCWFENLCKKNKYKCNTLSAVSYWAAYIPNLVKSYNYRIKGGQKARLFIMKELFYKF
jgi:hypothetical protein